MDIHLGGSHWRHGWWPCTSLFHHGLLYLYENCGGDSSKIRYVTTERSSTMAVGGGGGCIFLFFFMMDNNETYTMKDLIHIADIGYTYMHSLQIIDIASGIWDLQEGRVSRYQQGCQRCCCSTMHKLGFSIRHCTLCSTNDPACSPRWWKCKAWCCW